MPKPKTWGDRQHNFRLKVGRNNYRRALEVMQAKLREKEGKPYAIPKPVREIFAHEHHGNIVLFAKGFESVLGELSQKIEKMSEGQNKRTFSMQVKRLLGEDLEEIKKVIKKHNENKEPMLSESDEKLIFAFAKKIFTLEKQLE